MKKNMAEKKIAFVGVVVLVCVLAALALQKAGVFGGGSWFYKKDEVAQHEVKFPPTPAPAPESALEPSPIAAATEEPEFAIAGNEPNLNTRAIEDPWLKEA